MIKILQVLDCLGTGGIQSFIMNIYRNIDKRQYKFDFLVTRRLENSLEKEAEELGANIYVVPPRSQGIRKNKQALKRFFSEHSDYDVIHEHESSLSYVEPLIIGKQFGIQKRIFHSHNTNQKGLVHKVAHIFNQIRLRNIVTDVFACSELAAKWALGNPNRNYPYVFIPNGIDVNRFEFNSAYCTELKKEFGIEEDYSVLGLIGRLTRQKNHRFLIDVFDSLCENGKYKLLLIGDGELRTELENYAKTKKCCANIIFVGDRNDAYKFYSVLDCMIMPSINEGLPVTLVEAQASGLPCFVSDKVTKMVKITDLLHYLPLNNNPIEWAEHIKSFSKEQCRKSYLNDVLKSDFNICNTVRIIENEYNKKH